MTLANDNGTDGQTDRETDRWTDRQTDRQTDRRTDRVRRNMRPPPMEEGRIIIWVGFVSLHTTPVPLRLTSGCPWDPQLRVQKSPGQVS